MDQFGQSQQKGLGRPAIAVAAAVGLGMALVALNKWVLDLNDTAGTNLGWANFLVVPYIMGVAAAFVMRVRQTSVGFNVALSAVIMACAVGASVPLLGEGYICLMIVSPLVLLTVFAGTLTGRYLFRARNTTLNVSLAAVAALALVFDMFTLSDYQTAVTDTVIVKAPPGRVWQYVVAFDSITAPPAFWMFRIGLPAPVSTTVASRCQGAARRCVFSNGAVFHEVMTVYRPGCELTFDMVRQPADPEVVGHITCRRGQFLLKDNGDGTTTLTGTSWYALHVHPAWYYDLWATAIVRNVHLRVMRHIKQCAEMAGGGVSDAE